MHTGQHQALASDPDQPVSSLRLADDHPIRSARWIWPAPAHEIANTVAEFRTDFRLDSVPAQAPLWITADQHYRLWVNGAFVCRGPARGYQRSWPVDEVDIASYLRPGVNWLAVEGYNPGISTFRYLHEGFAGMLCAAHIGPVELRSDRSWRMRVSPRHVSRTKRLSMQLDFQEHVRLGSGDRSWIEDEVCAGPWGPPPGLRDTHHAEIRVGAPPWLDLEARGIPLLGSPPSPARMAVVAVADGTCAAGWSGWEDASWPWQGEADGLAWRPVADPRRGDMVEMTAQATGPDRFQAQAIDLGEYIAGSVEVELECGDSESGSIVDIHYHERLVDGRPDRRPPGVGCSVALASRLHLARGRHRHAFCHILAFSVLTVVVRGTSAPLRLRLRVRPVGYPFAMVGGLACDDAKLDGIVDACRRTLKLCALDAYVDTPWREQAQWWGDARIQARTGFLLDPDARLLHRGIRSIAGQAGPYGLTYAHAPTMAHNCVLPDFSLTWIMTLWDLYWQTGDATVIDEQWGRVCEVLAYFRRAEVRHPSGLLRHDRRFWYFGDWSELHRGDVPAFLNLWYIIALQCLARLLAAAGRPEAAEVGRLAARHSEAVLAELVDPGTGLVRPGMDDPGRMAVHDQVLAMMAGVSPGTHQAMLERVVLPWIRGTDEGLAVPSASWCTHAYEVLVQRGHIADVVGHIRRHWSPMLATGTTWGGFTWSEEKGGSASHAWTAHPAAHLINGLAGVRQTAPAWRAIRLHPCPVPGISRARALVPTPQGEVSAGWEIAAGVCTVTAEVPDGVTVDIRLPDGGRSRWSGGGRRSWSFSVAPTDGIGAAG